ncbi:lytic transglycosylase, catalytic [Pseudomonas aeruginosa]|nr:lytic transglycosylase, catalytic [Pseudomonas aeruginosa]
MKPSIILSALLLASTQWPAWAQQPATAPARNAQSQERPLVARILDDRVASDWGLQPQEWARYRELMDGPLGIYSPNLDPLSALGIEARTDEERRRYAELQVQVEARRVEKLLAYQKAYDEAWQRLNPGMQRVNLPDDKPVAGATRGSGRTAVFVKDGCEACGQLVQRLQSSGTEFDLYMVGSRQDDARIRDWAKRANVDPARVRRGTITLNHDGGRWLSLGLARRLARGRARGERPMAAPAVVASLRALVLAAGLYAGAAHAQEVPPPAYQLAAQRAGIPSTVLYAVALQESGIRRNGRIVPWPWSLNVAGQSRRYATRADACASLQRAMRSTPHTRIDAGLGQINLGYHQHRYASACDLLDPYRNLAIAAEILREQHTPGEDWLLAIGRYHRPAGGEPAARYRRSVSRHLARVQGARPTAAVLAARQETSP